MHALPKDIAKYEGKYGDGYAAMIDNMDQGIGRIVQALREWPQLGQRLQHPLPRI